MKTLHYILLFFIFILITTNNNIYARKKNKLKRKGRKNNNTKNKNALSYRIQHRISLCGSHFEQGRVEDGRKDLKQLLTKQSTSFHSKIANEIFPIAFLLPWPSPTLQINIFILLKVIFMYLAK